MNTKQKLLIERLRLEVICPTKARVLCGKNNIRILRSNYRFLSDDEVPLWKWSEMFKDADLNLRLVLRKIIKKEIGNNFDIKDGTYSGYLGVTSDHWIEVVKTKSNETDKRRTKQSHLEKVAA
ncbi:MAG: hypothetical protein A3C08_01985 [Candidatus Taylorbacteria bacterium RIFCSPHIGHO2_02_FULL_47_18]|uniref:Uncharacterized protein n=1 Tax=Candidatus Taylorbacteria bacterium RIFCSPLOWO2_01_FULL_48_100 TaxID=1802322 RepID=A0A1G2NF21_9BACT|nr:MAG: hypothetical protein A2670_02775 [Candidatus Taylorbacteria bacterium RIFCSPHIGHO2_01_FULL_48_38]OHA28508.1 MAG: hypothetical protein A3C08_01985 [Candidatus Taylorbacteria bacterium RIFCSPHIGHO2_02_FULL_47_18]OHA34685.1 MAG: hypothetical protein A2938_00350 [Candidatus Taylorbacteria bacterium RIFCSPLOWO2_01_FULL_48_100]OHA40735.1 MAG: hypothetical protein A3J31_00280 [Candidatus Taylorbacteria bacterium RIFCSPLOWO2_02_FULL_48_16]OHA45403.1 MAG: hypothetical protein A3H13_01155 [Candid